METPPPSHARSLFTRIALTLLILPVLYVLSIGPAFVVAFRFSKTMNIIGPIYTPVIFAAKKNSSSGQVLESYLSWWLRVGGITPETVPE